MQCCNGVEVMLETIVMGARCSHTLRLVYLFAHTFIMDFLFESNKAVPSVPIQMSLLEFCIFKVPAEHFSDTFPDIYPCYVINYRRQERHDINLRIFSVLSCFLSL